MAKVSLRAEFPQQAADIWAIVGDPGGAAAWIPALGSVRMDGDLRHVVFTDGAPARERIVAHNDGAREYTYEYIDGPLPLAHYTSTIRVGESASGAVVEWDADFAAVDGDPDTEAGLVAGIGQIYQAALDEVRTLAAR